MLACVLCTIPKINIHSFIHVNGDIVFLRIDHLWIDYFPAGRFSAGQSPPTGLRSNYSDRGRWHPQGICLQTAV